MGPRGQLFAGVAAPGVTGSRIFMGQVFFFYNTGYWHYSSHVLSQHEKRKAGNWQV